MRFLQLQEPEHQRTAASPKFSSSREKTQLCTAETHQGVWLGHQCCPTHPLLLLGILSTLHAPRVAFCQRLPSRAPSTAQPGPVGAFQAARGDNEPGFGVP